MKARIPLLALAITALIPSSALGRPVTLPAGTVVYGQLDERVVSKKKDYIEGEFVRAHVWRDVVVNGRVVIGAGDPMLVQVSRVKAARFGGSQAELELQALTILCANGAEVPLAGGYDQSARGQTPVALSQTPAIKRPLVFLQVRQAVLEVGTVFDATVGTNTAIPSHKPAPKRSAKKFRAEVLYDALDPDDRSAALPVTLRKCQGAVAPAAVVTVNGQGVAPIPVTLEPARINGGCADSAGQIDLKQLSKHFNRGINYFEVEVDGTRAEVILEIEM